MIDLAYTILSGIFLTLLTRSRNSLSVYTRIAFALNNPSGNSVDLRFEGNGLIGFLSLNFFFMLDILVIMIQIDEMIVLLLTLPLALIFNVRLSILSFFVA